MVFLQKQEQTCMVVTFVKLRHLSQLWSELAVCKLNYLQNTKNMYVVHYQFLNFKIIHTCNFKIKNIYYDLNIKNEDLEFAYT